MKFEETTKVTLKITFKSEDELRAFKARMSLSSGEVEDLSCIKIDSDADDALSGPLYDWVNAKLKKSDED